MVERGKKREEREVGGLVYILLVKINGHTYKAC